jgi:glutathione S-transferase
MDKIFGAYLSPFVRKVVLAMEHKGVEFELVNAAPGMLPEGYELKHPLKKIPTFQDEEICVPDSSVICQYLDDKYPEAKIIPTDPVLKAKALWIEEFSDSKLAETCGGALFFQRFMKPLFGKKSNEEMVEKNLNGPMKEALAYLDSVCLERESSFLVGKTVTVADFAVVSHFINAKYVGYEPDIVEFPNFVAYMKAMCATDLFAKRIAAEEKFAPKPKEQY